MRKIINLLTLKLIILFLLIIITNSCQVVNNNDKQVTYRKTYWGDNFDFDKYVYFTAEIKDSLGNDFYEEYLTKDVFESDRSTIRFYVLLDCSINKLKFNSDSIKNCEFVKSIEAKEISNYFVNNGLCIIDSDTYYSEKDNTTKQYAYMVRLKHLKNRVFRVLKTNQLFGCISLYASLPAFKSKIVTLPLNSNKINNIQFYFFEMEVI